MQDDTLDVLSDEAMAEAIASGDVKEISTLVAIAILHKNLPAMKHLLDNGGELNCVLDDTSTPLERAEEAEDQEIKNALRPYCDAKTREMWDAEEKIFNALTGQPQRRLSQGSFQTRLGDPPPQAKNPASILETKTKVVPPPVDKEKEKHPCMIL